MEKANELLQLMGSHPACGMKDSPPVLPHQKGHGQAGVAGLGHGISEKTWASRKGNAIMGRVAEQRGEEGAV